MEKKIKKLNQAHKNNVDISNMQLKDKFEEFEENKLKESQTLLYEATTKPKWFKRYPRGSIVKVRFGTNIGSEFSGNHYAIVISKNDTKMNPVLHVIPITSKKHLKSIEIGNSILFNSEEMNKLKELYKKESDPKQKKEINKMIKYYNNCKNKTSFAFVEHLRTVSKLSIIRPFNKYDYLEKIKCSKEILSNIDEEIIKEFTL